MSPKLKKIARFCFIGANLITVVLYLTACLVPFLSAGTHWLVALLGLIFPLLFVGLLTFLLYWLFRKSKWVFICIAALAISWQQITAMLGLHFNKKFVAAKATENIRVLSWNLSSWGGTNRMRKAGGADSYQNEMIAIIKDVQADVLCFQEYPFFKYLKEQDSIPTALKEIGYQYMHLAKYKYTKKLYRSTILTTVAILSKYPITDTATFFYKQREFAEPLVYTDIKINNYSLRIFTAHLQSVRFGEDDYEALHKLKEPGEVSVTESKTVINKLRQAYNNRGLQADFITTKIKESPYPVIICGDFNDVPNSYTYFTVKGNLQDAFLQKGWGFGRTFRYISPTLRIDYILADKKSEIKQFSEIKVPYSDHYPVVADFGMEKNSLKFIK